MDRVEPRSDRTTGPWGLLGASGGLGEAAEAGGTLAGATQPAVALGVGRARLLFRHVLPNVAPSIIVVASLQFSQFIVAEAAPKTLALQRTADALLLIAQPLPLLQPLGHIVQCAGKHAQFVLAVHAHGLVQSAGPPMPCGNSEVVGASVCAITGVAKYTRSTAGATGFTSAVPQLECALMHWRSQ